MENLSIRTISLALEDPPKAQLPIHEYCPIKEDELRIMYLQPGFGDDELECSLKEFDADNTQPYEALSYRWGKTQDQQIICNGHSIPVSPELCEALRRYRYSTRPRTLWIDQICIDQTNKNEVSAQVKAMPRIYSGAQQVLVWLGEENQETRLAFNLIDDITVQLSDFMRQPKVTKKFDRDAQVGRGYFPLRLSPSESPECIALRNLNERSWFTRTWTFQELLLAKEVKITCGSFARPWNRFFMACETIYKYELHIVSIQDIRLGEAYSYIQYLAVAHYHSLPMSRKSDWGLRSLELLNLVRALRKNKTSDPKDRLFALLGCANDVDSDILKFVNYDFLYGQVYIAFTKWFINRYEDLTVLQFVSVSERINDTPSWTPNFQVYGLLDTYRFSDGKGNLPHNGERTYNATGSSKSRVTLNIHRELYLR